MLIFFLSLIALNALISIMGNSYQNLQVWCVYVCACVCVCDSYTYTLVRARTHTHTHARTHTRTRFFSVCFCVFRQDGWQELTYKTWAEITADIVTQWPEERRKQWELKFFWYSNFFRFSFHLIFLFIALS